MLFIFLLSCLRHPRTAATPHPLDTAWTPIGHSVDDRPIHQKTLGHGRHVVLWIGGIHGDEPEGAGAGSGSGGAMDTVWSDEEEYEREWEGSWAAFGDG